MIHIPYYTEFQIDDQIKGNCAEGIYKCDRVYTRLTIFCSLNEFISQRRI